MPGANIVTCSQGAWLAGLPGGEERERLHRVSRLRLFLGASQLWPPAAVGLLQDCRFEFTGQFQPVDAYNIHNCQASWNAGFRDPGTKAGFRRMQVCLKGTLFTPLSAHNTSTQSLNVQLRKELDLHVNLVHGFNIPGVPSRFSDVDVVVIRCGLPGHLGLPPQSTWCMAVKSRTRPCFYPVWMWWSSDVASQNCCCRSTDLGRWLHAGLYRPWLDCMMHTQRSPVLFGACH